MIKVHSDGSSSTSNKVGTTIDINVMDALVLRSRRARMDAAPHPGRSVITVKTSKLLVLVGVWISGVLSTQAGAQNPSWNRTMQAVGILPVPAGGGLYDITAVWSFDVDDVSAPLDLSTHVTLLVNSGCVGSPSPTRISVGDFLDICSGQPPCSDGVCGHYSDGITSAIDLGCHKVGNCAIACFCRCGAWRSTLFPGVALTPGDEITIILYPAPGAAPDHDTSDDMRRFTFHGGAIAWNRGVEAITTTPSPTGGTNIQVSGYVEFDGPQGSLPAFMHLDLEVELQVSGTTHATNRLDIEATRGPGPACFQAGCLDPCGSVGGVEKTCANFPNPILGCVCGGNWLTTFNAVPLTPGDEITIILRPAPATIPELIAGDDALGLGTVSADRLPTLQTRLGQNAPNPFAPETRISFTTAEASHVAVEILDLSGRRIRMLVNQPCEPGEWTVPWDGRGDSGERLSAGTYFYRLAVNGRTMTRKMILLP